MKEAIIDNTNVIGCKYFQENYGEYWQGYWEYNDICHKYVNFCADNPNCEYKRLNNKRRL